MPSAAARSRAGRDRPSEPEVAPPQATTFPRRYLGRIRWLFRPHRWDQWATWVRRHCCGRSRCL